MRKVIRCLTWSPDVTTPAAPAFGAQGLFLVLVYVNCDSGPAAQKLGLPKVGIRCPKPWARDISRRLCGVLAGILSERPILKSNPPPTRTKGMLSSECE